MSLCLAPLHHRWVNALQGKGSHNMRQWRAVLQESELQLSPPSRCVFLFLSRANLMEWSFGLPANIKQLPLPDALRSICFCKKRAEKSPTKFNNNNNNDDDDDQDVEKEIASAPDEKLEITWLFWLLVCKHWLFFRKNIFLFPWNSLFFAQPGCSHFFPASKVLKGVLFLIPY